MSVKNAFTRTFSSFRAELNLDTPSLTDFRTIVECEKDLMKKRSLLLRKLQNPLIYQEFMQFMSVSKAANFVFLLNIIFLFMVLPPVIGLSRIIDHNPSDSISFRVFVVEVIFVSATIVSGWLLYGCLTFESCRMRCEEVLRMFGQNSQQAVVDYLQAAFYISLVALNGIVLVHRIWRGKCSGPGLFIYRWTCNPNAESDGFPLDSVVFLMFIPVLFTVVLREARVRVTITAWAIVLTALAFSCVLLQSSEGTASLVFYIAISGVIAYDSFKQFLLFYFLSHQLKKTIENNQRLADQNKATEMRHLIANVAHDLKTPLSSFMTGIDIISTEFSRLERKLDQPTAPLPRSDFALASSNANSGSINRNDLYSFIEEGQSCIANIRNTNAFMMMMINRCLDYTKASNGLKLVPKNATIKLKETLLMPLQCMANVQQKISMELIPFDSEDICSHIITDSQWLQENLLCLLSNAVKYSTGGTVQIKVTKWNAERWKSLKGKTKAKVSSVKVPCSIEDEVIAKDSDEDRSAQSSTGGYLRSNLTLSWYQTTSSLEEILEMPTTTTSISSRRNTAKIVPIDAVTEAQLREFNEPSGLLLQHQSSLFGEEVESKNCRDREELMFEVIDMGIGISEEAMKALFNPFKQTQRLAGGTGLGLYSLAKRIEALEGKYGVHQRQDGVQGSVFWFTIPYKPDVMFATHQAAYRHPGTISLERNGSLVSNNVGSRANSPRGRRTVNGTNADRGEGKVSEMNASNDNNDPSLSVLIAEDTPSIAKMTTMMLRRQHHRTTVAENGQIVLNKLYDPCSGDELETSNTCRYDVVLMDLQMPVMDGLEATRRIREHERKQEESSGVRAHQVVIGVSANSDHETMEEAIKAGVDDFLPKPFSVDAFVEKVRVLSKRLPFNPEDK